MSTPKLPLINKPLSEKDEILQRIEAQRLRLRERHARRLAALASRQDAQRVAGLGPDASLASRAAVFARLHPIAVAVAGAAALIVGPKRVIRWVGVAMPLVMKYRQR